MRRGELRVACGPAGEQLRYVRGDDEGRVAVRVFTTWFQGEWDGRLDETQPPASGFPHDYPDRRMRWWFGSLLEGRVGGWAAAGKDGGSAASLESSACGAGLAPRGEGR